VTRGDDLLASAGRQSYLAWLLDLPPVEYFHLPLVYNAAGQRLSKRDAALAGRALFEAWGGPTGVLRAIAGSIGLTDDETPVGPAVAGVETLMGELLRRFDWTSLRIGAWTV
jgi:glutamyl-tRNA synthetase